MEEITLEKKGEREAGWTFTVRVGGGPGCTEHEVFLPRAYYGSMAQERIAPEELVRNSFAFLLAREPKESILRKFRLPVIGDYFPDYEGEMKKLLPER